MGGGHASHEPFYVHSKRMYNLERMKYQKIKMPLAVFAGYSIGAAIPIFAFVFQQRKAKSS